MTTRPWKVPCQWIAEAMARAVLRELVDELLRFISARS